VTGACTYVARPVCRSLAEEERQAVTFTAQRNNYYWNDFVAICNAAREALDVAGREWFTARVFDNSGNPIGRIER
jgi:hypothetical protein